MQAITVSEQGGPEVMHLGEREIPEPGPDEVLVRVISAGVGPWDIHFRNGDLPAELPYVPGAEFSGVVVGDTGDSAAFEDGEPVYGYPGLFGCYAEYVTCPVEQLAPIPSGLDRVDAAALPVDGVTSYQGITEALGVGSGDTVLITGAAGGIGHLAVQIARVLGAEVIGTASAEDHGFVHKLGAALVVDHNKPDWPDHVRAEVGHGVDRVLTTSQAAFEGAAKAANDGAIIATPVITDQFPDTDRVQWKHYDGQSRGSDLIRMAPWLDEGTVQVRVGRRFFWKDAADAHRALESGQLRGRVLLIVDEDTAAVRGD